MIPLGTEAASAPMKSLVPRFEIALGSFKVCKAPKKVKKVRKVKEVALLCVWLPSVLSVDRATFWVPAPPQFWF